MKIDLSKKLDILLLIMLALAAVILIVPFFDIIWRIGLAFIAVYLLLKLFDKIHKPPHQ